MDVSTMLRLLQETSKEALAELPQVTRGNGYIHSEDYRIGTQLAAEGAANKMFGALMIKRTPLDRLKDLVQEYEKQYGDGKESLIKDLSSL